MRQWRKTVLSNWVSALTLNATRWSISWEHIQTVTTALGWLYFIQYITAIFVRRAKSKFARFATEVWGIEAENKSQAELANAGVDALADFIKEIGLPTTLRELGVTEQTDIKKIAYSCNIVSGSYKK